MKLRKEERNDCRWRGASSLTWGIRRRTIRVAHAILGGIQHQYLTLDLILMDDGAEEGKHEDHTIGESEHEPSNPLGRMVWIEQ